MTYLFIFSALQIICRRCPEQRQPDHQIHDCLQSQKPELGDAKRGEQNSHDSIEDGIPQIIGADSFGLQDVLLHQRFHRPHLFLMQTLARQRIPCVCPAFCAQGTLTVFAKTDRGSFGMVITDHNYPPISCTTSCRWRGRTSKST